MFDIILHIALNLIQYMNFNLFKDKMFIDTFQNKAK